MPRNPHLLLTTLVAILLFTALLLPTRTLAAVEVRNWLIAGAEQVLTYPQPAVKLLNGVTPAAATYLHRDALGSVRAITSAAGVKIEAAVYKPFGEQSEWVTPGNAAPETKGWIGERYDADAGLQYLNARYYDPALGLFLQPDWFEVTLLGVGTNRFSYSANDPVNRIDPEGNQDFKVGWARGWKNGARSHKEHLEIQDLARKNNVDGDNGTVAAPGRAWNTLSAKPKNSTGEATETIARAQQQGQQKFFPNPNGKKGGLAHQGKVAEIVQRIRDPGLIPRQEMKVETAGAAKTARYVDVSAIDPKTRQVVERYQVGKQTQRGLPVKREVRAMDDIEAADGLRPMFESYNSPF
jgi:RHS repeat-associated protein